ncbi:MAG: hypothetical protein NT118_08685 [Lentisphaerae bacterium]|nr:hypothetical protein [Lentisphaerota bacterium]
MKTNFNFRTSKIILVTISLVLAQLACGSSTVQQLASAVPLTVAPQRGTENAQTQAMGPTNTPKQTDGPQTPTPQPEPINLIAQGFGQDNQELGFAFIVENPNPGYAFENSQYQIAAYDANDTVVETDSHYIELILPSQKIGVGGTMYLNEGVTVAKIEVQLNAGDAEASDLATTFTTDKIVYRPGDMFSKALGVISNPYDRDITNLRISAVAYNEAGEIIGGGLTFLNFVLAKSTTGVDFSVTSADQVAKVELYPTVSGLSMLTSSDNLPEGAQNLALVKQGYGQDESQLGYGMLVQNPNSGFAIESTMYHITLYTEDGNVIATDEGYIDTLLPNQTLGVGGEIYVDEGMTVASADFQIKSGKFETSNIIPTFTAENVSYMPDPYSPKVTGVILSPYAKDITNLRVSAIVYNEANDIIGGGLTFLDFAPANDKTAVEVSIICTGTPKKVELYATVSSLSDIE